MIARVGALTVELASVQFGMFDERRRLGETVWTRCGVTSPRGGTHAGDLDGLGSLILLSLSLQTVFCFVFLPEGLLGGGWWVAAGRGPVRIVLLQGTVPQAFLELDHHRLLEAPLAVVFGSLQLASREGTFWTAVHVPGVGGPTAFAGMTIVGEAATRTGAGSGIELVAAATLAATTCEVVYGGEDTLLGRLCPYFDGVFVVGV